MYRWLVPRIVWPLAERFAGRRMWTEVCRLRGLQRRPTTELEARALERLRVLLAHATMHVPYYRDLFKRVAVGPDDMRILSDLPHLPVTTKAGLRADFPVRTTADNLPVSQRQSMLTSGCTGLPFECTGIPHVPMLCSVPISSRSSRLAPPSGIHGSPFRTLHSFIPIWLPRHSCGSSHAAFCSANRA